jgi:heptosyltransferase II
VLRLPFFGEKSFVAPQRILVMRYRFIGDTLLLVPFLRQLRSACPNALIDLLVAPQSGELLRDCPYIDNLIFFDTKSKPARVAQQATNSRSEQAETVPRSFWEYARLLRKNHYDTAFVLKRSFSSAVLAWLAGIPQRVGFDTEGRGFFLTHRVPYEKKNRHEIDCFLDALRAVQLASLEAPSEGYRLESWWSAAEEATAVQALQATEAGVEPVQRHVMLHLTSSNPAKEWSLAQARILADWLLSHPGWHVHCLGAASDAPVYERLRGMLSVKKLDNTDLPKMSSDESVVVERDDPRQRLHNHCGQFSLTESMAFLSHMAFGVGVDAGTLHMAAAAGIPVVALFGPSNDRKWLPPGAKLVRAESLCEACRDGKPLSASHTCMRDLRAEAVIETIRLMETEIKP